MQALASPVRLWRYPGLRQQPAELSVKHGFIIAAALGAMEEMAFQSRILKIFPVVCPHLFQKGTGSHHNAADIILSMEHRDLAGLEFDVLHFQVLDFRFPDPQQ